MTAQLVADALIMAIWRRGKPDALLHHSDSKSYKACPPRGLSIKSIRPTSREHCRLARLTPPRRHSSRCRNGRQAEIWVIASFTGGLLRARRRLRSTSQRAVVRCRFQNNRDEGLAKLALLRLAPGFPPPRKKLLRRHPVLPGDNRHDSVGFQRRLDGARLLIFRPAPSAAAARDYFHPPN